MVLNNDGVPCVEKGVWHITGYEKVLTGQVKIKRGRGYKTENVYEDKPKYEQTIDMVPAVDDGWKESLTILYPIPNKRSGRIELWEYLYTRDRFVCASCGTNRYTLLKVIGWSPKVYHLKHYGAGVMKRCFKCDVTEGPMQVDLAEGKQLKPEISVSEAKDIIAKQGLDIKIPERI